jgi:Transposase DDE domain
MVDGRGIPLDRVLPPANRHDSPLLAPTLDKLAGLGPLSGEVTVHLDAGYDSQKTRDELKSRSLNGEIAHKGDKAPIQAGQRSGASHQGRVWSRLGVRLRLVDPSLALVLGQGDNRAVPFLDHLLEVTRVTVAEFLDRIDADALEQLGILGTDAFEFS